MTSIGHLETRIESRRRRLKQHPLYRRIQTARDVRIFMEHHVFAVWDFMCLLKKLQRALTCTHLPWVPRGNPKVRRFINQIVLEEESDQLDDGRVLSHFELYRLAMEQSGADLRNIDLFLVAQHSGVPAPQALREAGVPEAAARFVASTLDLIEEGRVAAIAAAFTFGREEVIPHMFRALVDDLNQQFPGQFATLKLYLERHIELDGDSHAHLAETMVREICGDDPLLWEQAESAAVRALDSRIELWDGVVARLQHSAKLQLA
ncbi:DUF3050 domain-containing protein [Sulfidibacter corallicola]|uniref:DUF3050 domain-containing protein n=1 Tax=Sulfidibacter corallicola TaxID=2818388 RepID=A0A8A4TYG8_SULCO|nr:DUF3050 domain-containing protein [Sulfidibacter corallicola]QTD51575.1 DUF3050 domain-containing protein [Sulfidibacter corallicola]